MTMPRSNALSPPVRWLALMLAVAAALVAGGGDGDSGRSPGEGSVVSDAGAQHAHGLGVYPADGDLDTIRSLLEERTSSKTRSPIALA